MQDYNLKRAKLVIWDLDDTFWEGNLAEGTANFSKSNIKFLEELVTRGIMNSICSKNEFDNVKTKFLMEGYEKFWNYFIFPSINWMPKGERVKAIISSMGLREENVIFIDDNEINIQEVKFYCPNIMTAYSEEIEHMSKEIYLVNDYDFEHTRLAQYKILEEKEKDKILNNVSNEEFLKNSEIKIAIKKDCTKNIDRICKLILRTNQLNFTKNRAERKDLLKDFEDKNKESAYIIVEDKYGNYGVCGFYILDKITDTLKHFLFSCRILGMGIEQYVYSYLNFPKIKVQGEVAAHLEEGNSPDWIEIDNSIVVRELPQRTLPTDVNILFKGTCDLLSAIDYIKAENCTIDTELPYWNKDLMYILSHTHTAFIEQTHRMPKAELAELSFKFPFPNPDEFKTDFFNPKYDVIFLSLLSNSFSGLYKNKANGEYAVFGFANSDITDVKNWPQTLAAIPPELKAKNLQMLKQFKEEYIFAGSPPIEDTIKNLKYIRENINPQTELVLILGSEKQTNKISAGYEGVCESHQKINPIVRDFVKGYNNISIIELSELIENDDDYSTCINHFSRRVYVKMAEEFARITNKKIGKNCLSVNTQAFAIAQ